MSMYKNRSKDSTFQKECPYSMKRHGSWEMIYIIMIYDNVFLEMKKMVCLRYLEIVILMTTFLSLEVVPVTTVWLGADQRTTV